jgi:transposase-like protein
MQGGSSTERVASELGVSGWSLIRWSREASVEKASGLRAVEVVAEGSETATEPMVTLVTPDGYRIEGLRALEVGSVLEGLR